MVNPTWTSGEMGALILVVDGDEQSWKTIHPLLEKAGYQTLHSHTGAQGLARFRREQPDLLVVAWDLPDMSALTFLQHLQRLQGQHHRAPAIIVVLDSWKDDEKREALSLGVFDYVIKSALMPSLLIMIANALEQKRLQKRLAHMQDRQSATLFREFLRSRSPQMEAVYQIIDQVALSPETPVLIQGESGTGKEWIARLLHYQTPSRANEPFVEVNCAAIPEQLLESELFGHERGAFTDAKERKQGLLELAHRGTLFLDEVGEMSLLVQTKLLRVLETQTFRRVGGVKDISVDFRLVAATNRDLSQAVVQGEFRLDLFYRINVIPIYLPPLRERREDILPLAYFFLHQLSRKLAKPLYRFSPEAESLLLAYDYPGNIRELRNIVERAAILSPDPVIPPQALRLNLQTPYPPLTVTSAPPSF
ncbi:MAG: sigma-54-dependent Fis family transcriptional regulator, partial [Nitrospinota bacterium]